MRHQSGDGIDVAREALQIFADDLNNFEPVVGFSWDPWGNNKTAIRGSYRISYDKVYGRTLDTIEGRKPGLNGAGQLNAGQLAALYPLTNAFGLARTLRLADLAGSPTQAGVDVGNGNINLATALDITKTQKPLSAIPNTRLDFAPSDFEKSLVSPYSQSWSFGYPAQCHSHVQRSESRAIPCLREGDELRESAFRRRQQVDYVPPIGKVYIHSPEDLILYKLIYFGLSQQSKHSRDIAAILKSKKNELDMDYIKQWINRLGLSSIWKEMLDNVS